MLRPHDAEYAQFSQVGLTAQKGLYPVKLPAAQAMLLDKGRGNAGIVYHGFTACC